MEGHVKRNLFFTAAFAVLLSLPAGAQAAGRWKLTLENGHGVTMQGELILTGSAGAAGSKLLLESRDSSWVPLRDVRVNAEGAITFTVAAGDRLQFEGTLTGEELLGTVLVGRERRYRWRGVRLHPEDEYYAALPRFRQLQIRLQSTDSNIVLPGQWLAAAQALGENTQAITTGYTELSLRAGLLPLPPDSLTRFGLVRAMALFRREEMNRAATSTLTRIRANLRSDTAIARFDHLFRPAGTWQLDLHDVAEARARRPFPTLTWESARPALVAVGLLEEDQTAIEAIPFAVYQLFTQSHTDTVGYRATRQRLEQTGGQGAAAVLSLVQGYEEASEWYAAVMRFLLEQPWIVVGGETRSLAELVLQRWNLAAPTPEIRSHTFGYPEGAVRIGTDSVLASTLITPENASARDWLRRHGSAQLVATLHRLFVPFGERTGLLVGREMFRLSSVGEYARRSFSGFLEPRDVILLDPSYQPLLALGTLIHEWQHILTERARQADRRNEAYQFSRDQLVLTPVDPFLAEGFAEWLTDEILAGVLTEFPLLGFGEAEKRISLPQNDPHRLGYLLVRTLVRTLGDVEATRMLLVRGASDPALVTRDPRVRRAWRDHRGADRTMGRRSEPTIFPLTVFTIEDGEPDLVQSQIIAPYIPRP